MATLRTGMWPGFVARVATPATPAQIADDLVNAWLVVVGGEIPGGVLLATLSQVLLETGTREDPNHDGVTTEDEQAPGYWNGNGGNIRGMFNGQWTSFRAGEGHGAGEVILEPGPMNRFRSYIGPADDVTDPAVLRHARFLGVKDYLSLLVRRYPRALERARLRDYAGYVHELHQAGYFTASENAYAAAEARLQRTVENLPQVAAFLHDAIEAAA